MVSFKRVVATIAASALVAGSLAACSSAEDGPSVYFLNFKPEQDAIYQKIAAAYTEETGVPLQVAPMSKRSKLKWASETNPRCSR